MLFSTELFLYQLVRSHVSTWACSDRRHFLTSGPGQSITEFSLCCLYGGEAESEGSRTRGSLAQHNDQVLVAWVARAIRCEWYGWSYSCELCRDETLGAVLGWGGGHLSWGCEGVCGLTVDIYPSGLHNSPPCLQLDSTYKCCHSFLPSSSGNTCLWPHSLFLSLCFSPSRSLLHRTRLLTQTLADTCLCF